MGRAAPALLAVLAALLAGGLYPAAGVGAPEASVGESVLIDDFETPNDWTVTRSPGTTAQVVWERDDTGSSLRLDYNLANSSGFVILRKEVRLPLPENFAFTFRLRGEAAKGTLEFKVVDASGNVWWRRWPRYAFPLVWQQVEVRRSRLTRAWGPGRDGELREAVAIEIAVSGGKSGPSTLWIDDLTFQPREPVSADGIVPHVEASSFQPGFEPQGAVDASPATRWKSEPVPDPQWLTLDFGRNREYGGLVVDWDPEDFAVAYGVEVSADGMAWQRVFHTETGKGGRAYIYMPDAESRFVRLVLERSSLGRGFGITGIAVPPVSFSESPNAFFTWIAHDTRPGLFPKYLLGTQTYWTVAGVDGGDEEALVNEEGMVDIGAAFSIEPFVYRRGRLLTWHDAEISQELEDGALPMPSVVWRSDGLRLRITAFGAGRPGSGALYLRYRLDHERDGRPEKVRLFLSIRPFQVLPPWQALNVQGGVVPIRELRFDGQAVWVDRLRSVVPLTPPSDFGAATFEDGAITEFLENGVLPEEREVIDPFGFASGALDFDFRLVPGQAREVAVAVPFHESVTKTLPEADATHVAAQHDTVRRQWSRALDRVDVQLPPEAAAIEQTLRSTIGYILVNRDGPALQPGPRTYARSWIRDGAMESEALLQMGHTQEVQDFLRWYAGYQAFDGSIPCCVDGRGADWTPENDSIGAFIYALAEYYRYTHDAGFVHELWPNVVRAVDRLVALRAERTTARYHEPGQEAYFGLLPESISHEGYSGHPVHSYWDDFFALRGLKDAASLAVVVGDDEHADMYVELRDRFRDTLLASLTRTMSQHGIDYLPGSVELGDFDPTSTSIAIVTGGELERLPAAAVRRTYDRYWEEIELRLQGLWRGEAYSPYELRNVAAFVRLGERQRAHALLDYLMTGRRPAAWNQWAEVVWLDRDLPRFIGDMPHTWVAAGFVQAVRDMLAYEREADQALVVGAGIDPAWVTSPAGVAVRRLPTHWGILNFSVRSAGPDVVRVRISGDVVVPPGGIVLASPLDRPIAGATVNGAPLAAVDAGQVRVDRCPADVELRYTPTS
ncbi:MAG TPA: discoidin domain-containing protein [Candidatus Binatia bacterium]|nr:discoidin domain-containing protein [Candidatus Binatia bacterium]